MKKNMGKTDRLIRLVLGLILLVVAVIIGISNLNWLPIVLGILGLVMLITSAIGFCPLYCPLKISTKSE
ncbi:DUF2892 domain-containing protein [Candidatus Lokiarchaeum ossiferum]|uniref:DUF2892 domain-containing protein n=1 Tax=Candidatus Lokiarchaeum ossiferum TaxID=2951803 RepID=UPI00352BFB24